MEKEKVRWSAERDSLEHNYNKLQETVTRLEKKNETLVAQNEKLKERNKNAKRYNKYGSGVGNSSIIESGIGSRFATNKFLGVKELDQDNYSHNSSSKGARFGNIIKFIGDGEKGGDKKSIASGDENKMLEVTPDRYDKNSESTNTLSPQEDKE